MLWIKFQQRRQENLIECPVEGKEEEFFPPILPWFNDTCYGFQRPLSSTPVQTFLQEPVLVFYAV